MVKALFRSFVRFVEARFTSFDAEAVKQDWGRQVNAVVTNIQKDQAAIFERIERNYDKEQALLDSVARVRGEQRSLGAIAASASDIVSQLTGPTNKTPAAA